MGKPVAAMVCPAVEEFEPLEPLRPSEGAVLASVESLYADGLQPYGRILRKRLEEKGWEVDGTHLKSLCEASEQLRVVLEGAGEWSALLTDRVPAFVDIYSTEDTYPDSLWAAAEVYFEGMRRGEHSPLPGGRYASAHELASRHLAFLAEYSLGQVCHITQIAIQKKLLGYQGGAIVPYESSTAKEKSIFAQQQMASSNKKSTSAGLPVATWAQVQEHVQKLMETSIEKGTMRVPLSNVKRLFRSLFSLELSETALGYTKLSDLLQDTKFHKICFVKLEERGYAVLPVPTLGHASDPSAAADPACGRSTSDEASTCSPCATEGSEQDMTDGEEGSGSLQERMRFCVDEPLDFEEGEFDTPPIALVPPTPSPWYSSIACYQEPERQFVFCQNEPLNIEDACDEPLDFAIPTTPSPWPLQGYGYEQAHIVHIANFL
jgi:hypothetical protein